MNLRDKILQSEDLPRESVEVPEWGVTLYVRELTGTERDDFERSILGADGKVSHANFRAKLVARVAVNENGERVFGEEDAAALGAKSAKAITRVFDVATRLNGMTRKDVEELKKNSGAGAAADSSTFV